MSLLWLIPLSSAAVFEVGPFQAITSIQDALDQAVAGDVIELDPFTFEEDLVILTDVTVLGLQGAQYTVLSGDVLIQDAEVSVTGLTLHPETRGIWATEQARVHFSDVFVSDQSLAIDGVGLLVDDRSIVTFSDGGFSDLHAQTRKGGAIAVLNATLTVVRTQFTQVSAAEGGAIYAHQADVFLEDVEVSGATATGDGGAIRLRDDSTLLLEGAVIADGAAVRGGAVAVSGSSALIRGASLLDNATEGDGGAIHALDTSLSLSDTLASQNRSSEGAGGQLFVDGGTTELFNVTLENGRAGTHGGAIAIRKSSLVYVTGSCEGHTVTDILGTGGCIDAQELTAATLDGVSLARNSAPAAGGAIAIADASLSLVDSTFSDNESDLGGAVYHRATQALSVSGCHFEENLAASDGGAIYWRPGGSPSTLTVKATGFVANAAGHGGGGIFGADGNTASISDSRFDHNRAGHGAGFEMAGVEDVVTQRSSFCANSAEASHGGAVSVLAGKSHQFLNNRVVDNSATTLGGGLYQQDVVAGEVYNNTFVGQSQGALHFETAAAELVNNIVAHTSVGHGVTRGGYEAVALDYNSLFDNLPTAVGGSLDPQDVGSSNLQTAPVFIAYSPDGDCSNDVISLAWESALVDAGDDKLGDLDGTPSDLGADGGPHADPDFWQDHDSDGVVRGWDCDDTEPDMFPGNLELPYDGLDNDCKDGDLCDVDGDGYVPEACGGFDCNDQDADLFPGSEEIVGDGIDQDCNGADLLGEIPGTLDPPSTDCGCTTSRSTPLWLGLLLPLLLRRRP